MRGFFDIIAKNRIYFPFCSPAGYSRDTETFASRAWFTYNRYMQHELNNSIRKAARIAVAMLFTALFLMGCAAPPAPEDLFIDADSTFDAGTDLASPAGVAAKSILLPAPIESVLPDDGSFAALFVNVGKADACILRFGSYAVMIDTGSAASVPQLFAALNALKIESIDAVFVSHSHSDHLGGLDALAGNYSVGTVYSSRFGETDKDGVGKIVKRAEKLGLSHTELNAGDVVPLREGASLTVLGPLALNEENDNDNSLVLRLEYNGTTILFAGDMQFAEEQTLLDAGAALNSTILKVGNHGNPDATGELLAKQVAPAVAVISTDTAADENSANPRVITALMNANVFVTEDFPIGVLVTVGDANHSFTSNPAKETATLSAAISVDAKNQSVTLTNTDADDADLSGCVLFCAETGAALRLPDGTLLPAGGSLTVGKGNRLSFPGDGSPLRKKKDNTVFFYDSFGNLIGEGLD